MDGQRLDRITKSLATQGSRRRVLRGLAAGGIAAVTGAFLRGEAGAAQFHTCCCYTCQAIGQGPYCQCQRGTFCEAGTGCIPALPPRQVTKCSACSFGV